jgi:hypothetical protein
MCLLEGRVVYGNLFLTNKIIIFQVTLSGNQEPVRVEITEAALGEGAEVSLFSVDRISFSKVTIVLQR